MPVTHCVICLLKVTSYREIQKGRERKEESERQIFERRKRAEGMAETIDEILDFSDMKSLTIKVTL